VGQEETVTRVAEERSWIPDLELQGKGTYILHIKPVFTK
jgi:hypothetical protein